jgi:predicted metal-binding transcription factor (methanogenesis marker protein 9)
VYIGTLEGPKYVGLALTPEEYIDLKKARYVDEELELTGYGFTRRAPLCCPDLLVTKTVALRDGELVKTGLTKEPYKDKDPLADG